MMKVVRAQRIISREAGVALVEMVLVAAFVIAAGVTVLLTVIWPAYTRSTTEERLVAGYESALAASRGIQRLSIEGNQLQEALTALQDQATHALSQAHAVSDVDNQCAAFYCYNAAGPIPCVRGSADIPTTFDQNGNSCKSPPAAAAAAEALNHLDPTQSGIQVRMILYHLPTALHSLQRETTNVFSAGSAP